MPTPVSSHFHGQIDLDALPRRLDRRGAAAFLCQHFFPVRPRTLERWPLPWQTLNGRAVVDTASLVAEAERRLADAPIIRGGRSANDR